MAVGGRNDTGRGHSARLAGRLRAMDEPAETDHDRVEITPDPTKMADIVATLETVSEQLGDASIDLLRRAMDEGATRPPADKALASARRAVDKAIRTLDPLQ